MESELKARRSRILQFTNLLLSMRARRPSDRLMFLAPPLVRLRAGSCDSGSGFSHTFLSFSLLGFLGVFGVSV